MGKLFDRKENSERNFAKAQHKRHLDQISSSLNSNNAIIKEYEINNTASSFLNFDESEPVIAERDDFEQQEQSIGERMARFRRLMVRSNIFDRSNPTIATSNASIAPIINSTNSWITNYVNTDYLILPQADIEIYIKNTIENSNGLSPSNANSSNLPSSPTRWSLRNMQSEISISDQFQLYFKFSHLLIHSLEHLIHSANSTTNDNTSFFSATISLLNASNKSELKINQNEKVLQGRCETTVCNVSFSTSLPFRFNFYKLNSATAIPNNTLMILELSLYFNNSTTSQSELLLSKHSNPFKVNH